MAKRIDFGPGTLFAVPLEPSGFGLGLIARGKRRGRGLIGYFFGPATPTLEEIRLRSRENRLPRDAILIAKFGYLGLRMGTWPVLGSLDPWKPQDWPMPEFSFRDPLTGEYFVRSYSEEDPVEGFEQRPARSVEDRSLPQDGANGHEVIEFKLSEILAGRRPPRPSAARPWGGSQAPL